MEFILDHLREIARASFMKKVQPAIKAIDTQIKTLKKEVVDLCVITLQPFPINGIH